MLALVTVLSLAACGSSSRDKDDDDDGGSSYETPIKNYIDLTFKGKTGKIETLAPKQYWECLEEEEDITVRDLKKELSDKTLEGIAEALNDTYDIDMDSVKAGYQLEAEFTIKGSEDEEDDDMEITVIKIGSKWYWINYYDSGDGYYVRFIVG